MTSHEIPASRSSRRGFLIRVLRDRPAVRSIAYGLSIRTIAIASSHIVDPSNDYEWSMSHVLAFNCLAAPFTVGVTYAFVTLREQDVGWWNEVVLQQALPRLFFGIALGSGVYLGVISVAVALDWVRFPAWGWQTSSAHTLVWTLVSHAANLLVAWNEEVLYRGYGLRSLSHIVGFPLAVSILVPYFAIGHGTDWQVLIGQSSLGLATTGLLLAGDSLWLPVGYHAAWNYLQTAVLGPSDASSSLLPMHVDGPKLWMGRPGYPEPGLLATLAHLLVAVAAFLMWWRSRPRALRHTGGIA